MIIARNIWMNAILCGLEVYNSVLERTKGTEKFEIYEPIERKEKRFSWEDIIYDDEDFGPENFEEETLRSVVKVTLKNWNWRSACFEEKITLNGRIKIWYNK